MAWLAAEDAGVPEGGARTLLLATGKIGECTTIIDDTLGFNTIPPPRSLAFTFQRTDSRVSFVAFDHHSRAKKGPLRLINHTICDWFDLATILHFAGGRFTAPLAISTAPSAVRTTESVASFAFERARVLEGNSSACTIPILRHCQFATVYRRAAWVYTRPLPTGTTRPRFCARENVSWFALEIAGLSKDSAFTELGGVFGCWEPTTIYNLAASCLARPFAIGLANPPA
jgi:hypothetical protein